MSPRDDAPAFDYTPAGFAIVDATLAVTRWGHCAQGDLANQPIAAGETLVPLAADAPSPAGKVLDPATGALVSPAP